LCEAVPALAAREHEEPAEEKAGRTAAHIHNYARALKGGPRLSELKAGTLAEGLAGGYSST